jgi:hypothetical protein
MTRVRLLALALPLAGIVFLLTTLFAGGAAGGSDNAKYRWDIVSLDFATLTLTPGGQASAYATTSGNPAPTGKITLTGSGTFRSNSGSPQAVTGGGTWQTFDASGTPTGSGTYDVTGFVSFHLAPGFLPSPPFTDRIGPAADARSGLAVLQIAYSDGSDGILVVSCNLPGKLEPNIFEGITASKGYVDYWDREAPVAGVDADRTEFHVVH